MATDVTTTTVFLMAATAAIVVVFLLKAPLSAAVTRLREAARSAGRERAVTAASLRCGGVQLIDDLVRTA